MPVGHHRASPARRAASAESGCRRWTAALGRVRRAERAAGDEEPTRALHDARLRGARGGRALGRDAASSTGCAPTATSLDALTLVADLHGEVVGHLVCSRATMGEGPSIALGPIAVHPDAPGPGHRLRAGRGGARHGRPAAASRRSSCSATPGGTPTSASETAAEHGIGSPGPWADRFFQVAPAAGLAPRAGRCRSATPRPSTSTS